MEQEEQHAKLVNMFQNKNQSVNFTPKSIAYSA